MIRTLVFPVLLRRPVRAVDAVADDDAYRPISWRLVKRLLARMRVYTHNYVLVCAIGIVIAALEMIPPKLVGVAIDRLAIDDLSLAMIAWTGAAWFAVIVFSQVLHAVQIRHACRAGERVAAGMRMDLFAHLQRLSLGYFEKTPAGRILARASYDIEQLRGMLMWGLNTLVSNVALMVLASFMLLTADLQMFLLVAWLLPVMAVLSYRQARRSGEAWQEVLKRSTIVGSAQAENIAGVRVVTAFNRQEASLQAFNELQDSNTGSTIRASTMNGQFQATLQVVRFGGQLLMLLVGGLRVAKGDLSPGTLVASTLYWEWLMQPALSFGGFINDLMVCAASLERIFNLIDEPAGTQDRPGAVALPSLSGLVRFERVSFAYQRGRPVLHGIDFAIDPGSSVALVGTTGSGKTTLLALLARFYAPSEGRILLDGHDLAMASNTSFRRQMAMVPQNNFLFRGTVLDNLRYARPEATRAELYAAARALGCHEQFERLKDGYDTEVGERGSMLSLGERQLVCLTRALVASPRLLLLDEATSAIDPNTEAELQRAMAVLKAGRTTFIVAHRLNTVFSADLIMVMDHGRIVESGAHPQLLRQGGRYAELVRNYRADS